MKRSALFPTITLVATLSGASASPALGAAIVLGERIALTADTFALPVEIVNGVEVSAWQFDLVYDPADVQVHVACDPFADAYCSLLTGPMTEGDFFASGAPFNVLNPGFIELDPLTLEQIGRLTAVQGLYGGEFPGPSGSGVLAYVQFIVLGRGDSPIDIANPSVTDNAAVPEPGSLMLLVAGLTLAGGRHLVRRRRNT